MDTAYKYIELDASKREETSCWIGRDRYDNETCSPLMGLAGAAHSCYNRHCVLVVSPDDFWLTFLTAYMQYCKMDKNKTAAAEHLFEDGKIPEKKIRLTTVFKPDSIAADLEDQAIEQLKASGVNRELVSLFMRRFTSSKAEHNLAKALCVLKTYEEYIELVMMLLCGIPAVKMMGTLDDWKKLGGMVTELREHADRMKLPEPLPAWWWDLAQDICRNLVVSYEGTDKEKTVEWWSKIISSERYGSGGQVKYGGWLSQLVMITEEKYMPIRSRVKHYRVQMPVTFNDEKNCTFTVEATNWPEFKAGELDGLREMGVNYRWSIEGPKNDDDDEPKDLSAKKSN